MNTEQGRDLILFKKEINSNMIKQHKNDITRENIS